jgi:hypothetical protein
VAVTASQAKVGNYVLLVDELAHWDVFEIMDLGMTSDQEIAMFLKGVGLAENQPEPKTFYKNGRFNRRNGNGYNRYFCILENAVKIMDSLSEAKLVMEQLEMAELAFKQALDRFRVLVALVAD